MIHLFDIERKDLYKYKDATNHQRTYNRLKAIADIGLEEVSCASFGLKNKSVGLHIEMIWNYNDVEFENHLNYIHKTLAISSRIKTKVA